MKNPRLILITLFSSLLFLIACGDPGGGSLQAQLTPTETIQPGPASGEKTYNYEEYNGSYRFIEKGDLFGDYYLGGISFSSHTDHKSADVWISNFCNMNDQGYRGLLTGTVSGNLIRIPLQEIHGLTFKGLGEILSDDQLEIYFYIEDKEKDREIDYV